jgi:hypothetical protein
MAENIVWLFDHNVGSQNQVIKCTNIGLSMGHMAILGNVSGSSIAAPSFSS